MVSACSQAHGSNAFHWFSISNIPVEVATVFINELFIMQHWKWEKNLRPMVLCAQLFFCSSSGSAWIYIPSVRGLNNTYNNCNPESRKQNAVICNQTPPIFYWKLYKPIYCWNRKVVVLFYFWCQKHISRKFGTDECVSLCPITGRLCDPTLLLWKLQNSWKVWTQSPIHMNGCVQTVQYVQKMDWNCFTGISNVFNEKEKRRG